MEWDIFISHASEDRDVFVEPLAKGLKRHGFKVWYDKFCLQVGDSVRRSIEKGLTNSNYGLVVLSKNFFSKEWPQRELDSLFSIKINKKARILPIWLGIDHNEICNYSPLLADIFALKAFDGIESIISKIEERTQIDHFIPHDIFIEKIKYFHSDDKYSQKFILQRSIFNLNKLACYHNEKDITECPYDFEEKPTEEDKFYEQLNHSLKLKFVIPLNTYLDFDGYLKYDDIEYISSMIRKWSSGKWGPNGSYELFWLLDDWYDLDCMFILFDIPNYSISGDQRIKLEELIINYGSRHVREKFDPNKAYALVLKKYYSHNDS
jgi:TIR domain